MRVTQLVRKALLLGLLSPAGVGVTLNAVISEGVYLGNGTSHESCAENFGRDQGAPSYNPSRRSGKATFPTG